MARVQCVACGGTYDDVQADGLRYFHVCPPLSSTELAAAVKAGRVELPAGETAEDAVARRVYQRAGARDENVIANDDPRQPAKAKSDGKGTRPQPPAIADAPVLVPD